MRRLERESRESGGKSGNLRSRNSKKMATTAENKDEKGSIELPAPEGWAKKVRFGSSCSVSHSLISTLFVSFLTLIGLLATSLP